ncbi:prominin-1-A-like [Saccostrea cucullata]|uniref:prominin-1-A-like n=1 Tax=Saccostrea cuccullata TaxID=36930 RepID=UPI002ED578A3
MAIRVFIVVGTLLVIGAAFVGSATITDYFGNEAYDNGTILWASVPAGTKYKTTNSYNDGGLGALFAFARSFINTIQSKPFPFDLIKKIMNGEFDIGGQYMELINYAMGFGICVVIGLLYVVFLPLCGCCFCCCRCCGNCGGDMKAEYDDNEDCKRMGYAQAVFLLAILMTASAGCVYATNSRFTLALDYADGNIADNLDDIYAYSKNIQSQFRYIAIDMYTIVADAIIRDISGMGAVLTSKIFAVLDIDPVINAVLALDKNLNEIDNNLDTVIADKNSLVSAANTLSSSLSSLKSGIDSTKTSCASDCTPTTACDGFDTSQMTMNADFSALPDLSSVQTAIKDVVAKNLTKVALEAKTSLDNMQVTIDSETSSIQSSLQSTLDTFKSTLNTMVDSFLAQVNDAFNTRELKTSMGNFFKSALEYDVYRQYFGYGLMAIFSFIPVLLIVGILCGCCCKKKDVKPTQRGGCESCGGCLLILAVALMFIIGALLMLLTTVAFMIGGNFEKICQTFFDMSIFRDFVDQNGIPGFNLGQMLLNDPNANISLYATFLGCRLNKAPFELLQLNQIIPIDNYLNYSQYMGDIDTQINQISSAVDLSSYKVLTPDMEQSLNDFKNSGIDNINFTSINQTLSQSIVTIDLNSMISAMEAIRDKCTGTSRNNWIQHIDDTKTIRDTHLPAVETAKTTLQTSMGQLEGSIGGVTSKIDNVISTAQTADNQIQTNATAVLTDVALTYKNLILGYIDSYIERTRWLIFNDLANCLPLWNMYESFTTMLCSYTVDALNGFWFGTGWALVLFVPVIITSVKLSKYYRRMKECEGYGDDSDDDEDFSDDDDDYDYPSRYNQVSPS